jgi:hypothetical protein
MPDTAATTAKRFSTQWAAQFLVAAELARRGYTVAFTMGNNTPVADLTVGSPHSEKLFWVDVKGLSTKAAWIVQPKSPRDQLFYVLVHLAPPNRPREDEFFVLTQDEANDLVKKYSESHPGDKGKMFGFAFTDPEKYREAWQKLPT